MRIAGEHCLRGELLDAEAAQVDIGLLGLIASVTDLHKELAGLGIEDDALAVVDIRQGLNGIGGIALELHAVTVPVVT